MGASSATLPTLRRRAAQRARARPPGVRPKPLPIAPDAWARARLGWRAAHALATERPEISARFGLSGEQSRALWAVGVFCAGALAYAPQTTATMVFAALGAMALVGSGLRLTAAVSPSRPPRALAPRRDAPVYTVIAPLKDEAHMLAGLVQALKRLRYPAHRLDIILAIDEDDAATLFAARAYARDPQIRVLACPLIGPRTKPRACNYALQFARGRYTTIYDAEDRPHPDQLLAAVDAFERGAPTLGVLQAPLLYHNSEETWLTRQFALEYAVQFLGLLPLFARWGWPFPLGGTSNHFRTDVLRGVGGWDPYNVTEDADLGFRLAAAGWRADVIAPATWEEAAPTLDLWLKQRTRWLKGFIQTFAVQTRSLGPLRQQRGLAGPLALALSVFGPVLAGPLHAAVLSAGLVWLCVRLGGASPPDPPNWAVAMGAAGYAAALGAGVIVALRNGFGALAPHVLLTPIYWVLQGWACALAVIDLARRPFFWAKTPHRAASAGPQTGPKAA
ncbi:MAG: glycosyltransferase family 2 protein [Maricaulaceae bacterium]